MNRAGGEMLITADHGNIEDMVDEATGQPQTAHTTNPVPAGLYWTRRTATRRWFSARHRTHHAGATQRPGSRGNDRQQPDRTAVRSRRVSALPRAGARRKPRVGFVLSALALALAGGLVRGQDDTTVRKQLQEVKERIDLIQVRLVRERAAGERGRG